MSPTTSSTNYQTPTNTSSKATAMTTTITPIATTQAASATAAHTTQAASATAAHTTQAASATAAHTTQAASATAAHTTQTNSKVRLHNVIHGEWIKFWSVRSTSLTLLAGTVVTILFAMIFAATVGSEDANSPTQGVTDPLDVSLGAVSLAQLIVGVLGVIVIANEYNTGLIRTTFASVGQRTSVVNAKAAVVGIATFTLMSIGVIGSLIAGQAVYAGNEPTVALTDPDLIRVAFGTTVYLTGIALIGLALGFILRSSSGAIAALFVGVFIGPGLLSLLPESFTNNVLKYLPSEAGTAMMSRVPDTDLLTAGPAYMIFLAWVLGLLALAARLVHTRDA